LNFLFRLSWDEPRLVVPLTPAFANPEEIEGIDEIRKMIGRRAVARTGSRSFLARHMSGKDVKFGVEGRAKMLAVR
jgi:hypothetical protein